MHSQIARAGDEPVPQKQLESKLMDLLNRKNEARKVRDDAEARLSTVSERRLRVNPVDGLIYVLIPPGKFTMGCSPGDDQCSNSNGEIPTHSERVSSFWLGQTEVTQAAWKKVMNSNPSFFKSDQLPVEQVDWNQASDYCNKIGGRLPTETEWEYAARAGTTGARYGVLGDIAWYSDNSGGMTHPVALKLPNAFGLYDMLGNVWEWTADSYDTGTYKILRGGDWGNDPDVIRASFRFRLKVTDQSKISGLRCAGAF